MPGGAGGPRKDLREWRACADGAREGRRGTAAVLLQAAGRRDLEPERDGQAAHGAAEQGRDHRVVPLAVGPGGGVGLLQRAAAAHVRQAAQRPLAHLLVGHPLDLARVVPMSSRITEASRLLRAA